MALIKKIKKKMKRHEMPRFCINTFEFGFILCERVWDSGDWYRYYPDCTTIEEVKKYANQFKNKPNIKCFTVYDAWNDNKEIFKYRNPNFDESKFW